MVSMRRQGRRPLLWTHGQYLRFRTRTLTGSGTSAWLGSICRVSSHLRFRFSLPYRSSRGSFCKSSSALTARFSLDGPHTEVTSLRSTGSHSGVPRELKASSSSMSLPTADHGAPCNECSHRRAKHQLSVPTRAFVLLDAVWLTCSPAAFRLRDQQQQSSEVGASQTLRSGRSGTEPTCAEPAHPGRSVGAQHDRVRHPLRFPRGAPRSQ